MERAEKDSEIEFLTDCYSKAKVALCADYRGLTVAQITQLRRELREAGSEGRVVKNTLARISAEKVFAEAEERERKAFVEMLEGPSFMVFSYEDPVAPAKVLANFAKGNQNLRLKGGWLEGAFVNPEGVEALSRMPGRQEMLARLLSVINGPATKLLRLMNTPATQMVRVVDGHRSNLESKG